MSDSVWMERFLSLGTVVYLFGKQGVSCPVAGGDLENYPSTSRLRELDPGVTLWVLLFCVDRWWFYLPSDFTERHLDILLSDWQSMTLCSSLPVLIRWVWFLVASVLILLGCECSNPATNLRHSSKDLHYLMFSWKSILCSLRPFRNLLRKLTMLSKLSFSTSSEMNFSVQQIELNRTFLSLILIRRLSGVRAGLIC